MEGDKDIITQIDLLFEMTGGEQIDSGKRTHLRTIIGLLMPTLRAFGFDLEDKILGKIMVNGRMILNEKIRHCATCMKAAQAKGLKSHLMKSLCEAIAECLNDDEKTADDTLKALKGLDLDVKLQKNPLMAEVFDGSEKVRLRRVSAPEIPQEKGSS